MEPKSRFITRRCWCGEIWNISLVLFQEAENGFRTASVFCDGCNTRYTVHEHETTIEKESDE